jgi:hypothetical protein
MTDMEGRNCKGRQPEALKWTPSGKQPWYGTIMPERRFTRQQEAALLSAGKCPLTCETITVRRNAADGEFWWPTGSYPPFFEFECPKVSTLADGRHKIIAPSGDTKIVLHDGWVTKPGKRKAPSLW